MIIELIRVIFGLILVLFIPGYVLTWTFYPKKQDITTQERIAFSVPLSISSVMLSVLFADIVLGIDSTPINIVLIILSLILLSIVLWKTHIYIIDNNLKEKAIETLRNVINRKKEL